MDVEYCNGILEWVWKDVIMASISDCVLPRRGVFADCRGELCGVLGDVCMCGRVGCEDGLLEVLESI